MWEDLLKTLLPLSEAYPAPTQLSVSNSLYWLDFHLILVKNNRFYSHITFIKLKLNNFYIIKSVHFYHEMLPKRTKQTSFACSKDFWERLAFTPKISSSSPPPPKQKKVPLPFHNLLPLRTMWCNCCWPTDDDLFINKNSSHLFIVHWRSRRKRRRRNAVNAQWWCWCWWLWWWWWRLVSSVVWSLRFIH